MKAPLLAAIALSLCACAPMREQRNVIVETKTVKEHFVDGNGKESEVVTCTGEVRY